MKAMRSGRCMKLQPSPFPEIHFHAEFDPMWNMDHEIYRDDHAVTGQGVKHIQVPGFHGLWVFDRRNLVERVSPVFREILVIQ